MGETPSLDELAMRKRIIQAKMELHRTEIALYYRDITSPIANIRRRISKFATHPATLATVVAGAGFLLATRRFGLIRKAAKWLVPVALPTVRSFIGTRIKNAASKGLQLALRRD